MIETPYDLASVERKLDKQATEPGKAKVVMTISQVYDTDVEDLWDACTTIERIPRWLMPITGELRLGGRYQLEGNAGGTIETCDPPKAFTATWEFGGEVSWIAVRFTPDGDGARLTVEHSANVTDEMWGQFGPGAVGVGWDSMLYGLALHIATGAAVDPAEAMAWLSSPAGVRFVTESSNAWYATDVAVGTPEADARAAADRTTEAYTAQPEEHPS